MGKKVVEGGEELGGNGVEEGDAVYLKRGGRGQLEQGPRRGHTRVTAGLDPRMAGLSSILVPNGDAQQPEMPIRLLDTWLCATPLGSILVRCIFHPRVKTRGYPSVASSRPFGEAHEISSRSFRLRLICFTLSIIYKVRARGTCRLVCCATNATDCKKFI